MPDFALEAAHWAEGRLVVAGVDEAGRGCLAGPVVAAAVILPPRTHMPGLDDSKKLTPAQREGLFDLILREAIGIGIGQCSVAEVDQMNVLRASLAAMRRAVDALPLVPEGLLVDGNQPIPHAPCVQRTVVKGDERSVSVAAASVVAKVTRDRLMMVLDADFPMYGWARHKGYPTPEHYAALALHGPSPHHRRTFRLG